MNDEGVRVKPKLPMPPLAFAYCALLGATGIAVTITLAARADGIDGDVVARFLALAAAAAAAQLFVVRAPRDQTYHTTIVFLVAAALLLPPVLLPFVAVAQHVPEVVKRRERPRFSIFNTTNHALNMLAAAGVLALLNANWVLAGAAAAVTMVVLNHVLLAIVIRLTRGYSLRESKLFSVDSLAADVVPAGLGIALTAFWLSAPLLLPSIGVALFFVYRALTLLPTRLQPATA